MYSATSMLSKIKDNPIYGIIGNRNKNYYRNVYLQSEHWKNLRKEKLERNPICEQCGSSLSLDVHHVQYRNLYDVTLKDLQTLCRLCHNNEHKRITNKKNKKYAKVNRELKDYFDLRTFFRNPKINIFLIKWILNYILYNYYFSEMEKERPKVLRKYHKRQQENFDKKYKEIPHDINNYISIHY